MSEQPVRCETAGLADAASTSAHRRDDGDHRVGREMGCKAAEVADVLVADEDVDVGPDLSLLGNDAVAEARIRAPEFRQHIIENRRPMFDFDAAAAAGEFAKSCGDVEDHGRSLFFEEREVLVRVEGADAADVGDASTAVA